MELHLVVVWSSRPSTLSFSFLSYQSSPKTGGTVAWKGKNSDLLANLTFWDENTIDHCHWDKINKNLYRSRFLMCTNSKKHWQPYQHHDANINPMFFLPWVSTFVSSSSITELSMEMLLKIPCDCVHWCFSPTPAGRCFVHAGLGIWKVWQYRQAKKKKKKK